MINSTGAGRALLRRALATRRRDLVTASVLYSTHQIGESMVPVIIGAAVGQAIARDGWWRIVLWLSLLGADFLLLSMSYRMGARVSMRAKQHTAHQVRLWLTERAVRPGGGIRQPPGDLLNRAGSDAGRVGAFAGVLVSAVAAGAVLLVATALLLRFSLPLGAVILAGTALLLVAQDRVARRLRRHSGAEQQEAGLAVVMAEDLVRGLRVLKGIGAERTATQGYARRSRTAVQAAARAAASRATLSALGILLTGGFLTIIAGLGGWLALSGRLGLGSLVSALGLAQFVIGPMRNLAAVSAAHARALASATRVQQILDEPAGVPDGNRTDAPPPDGAIRFEEVSDGAGATVSFTAPAGALTGLVVDDARLNAAIPALLARDRDPDSGRISIGGTAIDAWPLDVLRSAVLVAPHDAALFAGTVTDNIGVRAVSEAVRDRAARAAFADQVVATLPDGARTRIGDRGERLSGGQRQRVALARALAADPPVLVLHDPTSAVDAVTEDRIAERLRELRTGRTTIVVTSSPVLLSRCDEVVLLTGTGSEAGTHPDLVGRSAAYRELVGR